MAFIGPLMPYIVAGASVASSIAEGSAAQAVGKIEADQLNRKAIADEAQAVQTAKFERRKAEVVTSRAKAVAAASGSSVASQDIQNLLSDIDQQGEYNALAALHAGYSSADSKRYAAKVAVYEGNAAMTQSMLSAGATILGAMDKAGKFSKSPAAGSASAEPMAGQPTANVSNYA